MRIDAVKPELMVEFYGAFIRTGYTTPRQTATLLRPEGREGREGDEGKATLQATWRSVLVLPVLEGFHKQGEPRMAMAHVVLQLHALFGSRRVALGATVLCMGDVLCAGDELASKTRRLTNCGVDTGGELRISPDLPGLP